jgi:Fur family ferric uptake transcriptional regulator
MSPQIQLLNSRGIRPTPVRILVLRTLQEKDCAVSLMTLEAELQTVDRSSIFRTLTLFLDQHIVHQVEDGSGQTKYALCEKNCRCGESHDHQLSDFHVHFYCENCRRTMCLHDVAVPEVVLPKGFTLNSANFVLKGLCAECQNPVSES